MTIRRLLYLTPYIPKRTGNGTMMRAAFNLEILAKHFDVSLLIVNRDGRYCESDVPDELNAICRRVEYVSCIDEADGPFEMIARLPTAELRLLARALYPRPYQTAKYARTAIDRAATLFAGDSFVSIYAFRINMVPFVEAVIQRLAGAPTRLVLDLDVFESRSARQSAVAYRASMGRQWSLAERFEARKLARAERRALAQFDSVLVAADNERTAIASAYGVQNVVTVPNGYWVPERPPPKTPHAEFDLLMVGSFNYTANEDAAIYLCREVIPRIVARAPVSFTATLVGSRPGEAVRALAVLPGVTVVADAPSLDAHYARADAVVVPLRAGAGTRIKILEAFSHGCPVVSTSKGAEGLDVRDGEHLLIADDAETFAHACLRLMSDDGEADTLAKAGFRLARQRHSPEAIARHLLRSLGLPLQ